MLDAKILTAVLASLTALAAGMNGGSIDAQDIRQTGMTSANSFNLGQFSSSPLQKLSDLFQTMQKPTNKVEAVLEVDTLYTERIPASKSTLVINNMTRFKMNNQVVKSDEQMQLHGFTGELQPGNSTKIKGRAQSLLTSGVNISGMMNVEENTETDRLVIRDTKRISLKFDQVKGRVTPDKASTLTIEGSPRQIVMESYSGDIIIYTSNKTVFLDGKVSTLRAGEFSYGG